MLIHTVKDGDTVFTVARAYSISPIKLIEYNGLCHPERLIAGQQIVLPSPTRTVCVREGDTVNGICRRYGIKKNKLFAQNPGLFGSERIYPGEELTVRMQPPSAGAITSLGYVPRDCTTEHFRRALPYVTYLSFDLGRFRSGVLYIKNAQQGLMNEGRNAQKTLLLRAAGLSLTDMNFENREKTTQMIVRELKEHRFHGIILPQGERTEQNDIKEFLLILKKKFLGQDLLLMTEYDGEISPIGAEISDAAILRYEKTGMKNPPSFLMGEAKTYKDCALACESSKCFMYFPAYGKDGDSLVCEEDILSIAQERGVGIETDPSTLLSFVQRKSLFPAHAGKNPLVYEGAGLRKEKLRLLEEYGYLGAAFDIGHINVSFLMMLQSTFAEVDYPFCTEGAD